MSKKDKGLEVGLEVVPTKSQAIAKISEIEPEYKQYLDRLDPEKRRRITNSINRVQTGLHTIAPIMCLGPEKCPFISKCPIPDSCDGKVKYGPASNYPIGKECILEKFFMQQKIVEYYEHLNVDPNNPVENSLVNELALLDLYKNRALMIMSVGDKSGQGRDFMRVDVVGFNENGDVAEQAKLHPAVEMIDKLEKRRAAHLQNLMETRKAKADWMAKMGNNQGESKILTEISKLREAILSVEEQGPIEIEDQDDELILLGD